MTATTTLTALVIDDEPSLVRVVSAYLEQDGFAVCSAADGETGLALARESEPDVVILDLGLPGMDGIEVCRQLRTFSQCYVMMLTARADEVDMLIGLAVGADDYMTKPFSPRGLVARVRTLLRRPRGTAAAQGPDTASEERIFGDLVVDVAAHEVRLGPSMIALTPTEHRILETLRAERRVFSRRQLLESIWDEGIGTTAGDEHLIDIHVGHLRQKLGDDARAPRYVLTVRGAGYRMGPG